MDFVTSLPGSPKGHEAIRVIVDRMMKTTHFIPVKINYSLDQLAQIYILMRLRVFMEFQHQLCLIETQDSPQSFGKAYIKLWVLILALVQPSTHK